MKERILSLLVGYMLGCFLTAEVVAYRVSGKGAAELGDTGNPGMANIMASLGFLPGLITLAGDLGKCLIAAFLSNTLFHNTGWIVTFYAGLGCTLGHDFPFWRKFRGGKGVATTSMAVCTYQFWPGLSANIIGAAVVIVTKYLCIGGPAIPLCFTVWMWIQRDTEAAGISLILTILSVIAHGSAIREIRTGKTKPTDVIGLFRKKI